MGKDTKGKPIFPPNIIRLCIDCYNGDMKGRMYNKMIAEPLAFENCCEMLLRADEMFDRCGYPQTFLEKRNFGEVGEPVRYNSPRAVMDDEEMGRQEGKFCTLDIYVRSRRKAGWQGVLMEKGGSPPREFHSEMELLEYIEDTIQKINGSLDRTEK